MAREATVCARLRALMSAGGGLGHLESLHGEAVAELGDGHPVALEIELQVQAQYDLVRAAEDALAAWADLAERSRRHLDEYHPLMMHIRSQHLRRLARRGEAGDLDLVVRLRAGEVAGRVGAGADEDWIGVARADLAVAMLDRARYGSLDDRLLHHDPDGDLAGAKDLIESELDRRGARHGVNHAFTWRARGVRGSVLVAQAARAGDPARSMLGAEALAVAEALVQHEWYRRAAHTSQALRGQLLRAEALSILERHREATCEARLASVLARRYRAVDAGHALMVLARCEAAVDPAAALTSATAALRARLGWYSEHGYQVAEARQLVDSLTGARV